MAEVTPRLIWNNLLALSNTVLSCSTAESGLPVRNLRDPRRSLVWRTPVGWTIIDLFNDEIPMTELVLGSFTVTIPAGYYATGAALAAAIETAINSVTGIANVYTVSYAASKFTISAATGYEAWGFEWDTYAGSALAGEDLGFVVSADDAGAGSYTADYAAYQSRHYVVADLGSAMALTSSHVVGHLDLGTGAVWTLQGHTADSWATPDVDQAISMDDDAGAVFVSSASKRYWRLLINEVRNAAGYTQVGLWQIGTYLEVPRGVRAGYTRGTDDLTSVLRSAGGAFYQAKRATAETLALDFPRLPRTTRAALLQMQEYLGVGRPMFVSLDPQNYPLEVLYMVLAGSLAFVHHVGDGDPPERWDCSMALVEALQ